MKIKSYFKIKILIIAFFAFGVLSQKAWSASLHESNSDSCIKSKPCVPKQMAVRLVSDTYQTFKSPLDWKGKQWLTFGAVAGVGVIAYMYDERVQNYMVNHQQANLTKVTKYGIEPFGSGIYSTVLLGGLYAGGSLCGNKRLASTSISAAESFIISSFFAQALKHAIHRHRPFQDAVPQHNRFDGPFTGFSHTSFPSGHSTAAFSIAGVFAYEYRNTKWVPLVAYGLATSVALSRVYDNKHWASDVVIGSCLGLYTGYMVQKLNKQKLSKVQIIPQLGNNFSSLALYYSF